MFLIIDKIFTFGAGCITTNDDGFVIDVDSIDERKIKIHLTDDLKINFIDLGSV